MKRLVFLANVTIALVLLKKKKVANNVDVSSETNSMSEHRFAYVKTGSKAKHCQRHRVHSYFAKVGHFFSKQGRVSDFKVLMGFIKRNSIVKEHAELRVTLYVLKWHTVP